MEDNEKALNQEAEEEVSLDSTPETEPKAPEEEVEQDGESTEEPDADTTKTEEKPKKGFTSRVRKLVKERNEAKEEAQTLKERMEAILGQGQDLGNQYTPNVQPGQELSPEDYRNHILSQADALVSLKLKQSEAVNRIKSETEEVLREFPELDPDSDSYDEELSSAVTEAIESKVMANPYSASPKQLAERLMKPYKRAVANEVSEVSGTLARQVSEAALKPTSVRKQEKSVGDKSIEELEAELGVVQA